MPANQLNSVTKAPGVAAAALYQAVTDANRALPPAIVRRVRRTVLVNVKMAEDPAVTLAKQAAEEGITQKQLICGRAPLPACRWTRSTSKIAHHGGGQRHE